jgi:hypothetical protein
VSTTRIRVVAGGPVDELEHAAIVEAVTRVLEARAARRSAPASDWARAGRLEATGIMLVRSRGALPRG